MSSDRLIHSLLYHPKLLSRDRPISSEYWLRVRQLFSLLRILHPFVLLVALCSIAFLARVALEERNAPYTTVQTLRFLPRGDVLKPALLGYTRLGADILWLQIVQTIGSERVQAQDYAWMYHALDVVTTLDPQFAQAFDQGSVVLAELAHRVDWSNALLEKGMVTNPQTWRLPFLLGFNYFFHLQDYGRAAEYMAQAAQLPGAPSYVPELAARLYAQADQPEVALRFVDALRSQTTDPTLGAVLDRRRNEVLIERDLTRIEVAIAQFRQQNGSLPRSLGQLVERGFLSAIPVEPFGGSYTFDVRTGRVGSSTHGARLRIFRPDGTQHFSRTNGHP